MSKGKKIVLAIGIFVVIVGGIALTKFLKKNSKAITVKTAVAQKGNIKSYLNTTGTIKSKNIKDYYGPQLKVSKVKVKVGDSVKKGDILVTFDNSDLQSAVKQAQLQYDNAVLSKDDLLDQKKNIDDTMASLDSQIKDLENKINTTPNTPQNTQVLTGYKSELENAKVKVASLGSQLKELGDIINTVQNVISSTQNTLQNNEILTKYQTDLEKAKAKRETLQSISNDKVKQSDNAVSLAKLSLDNAKSKVSSGGDIVADFDGIITAVNASEGGVANPSAPVIELQDLSTLKVVVSLSKSDVESVELDQSAVVKAGGKSYNGKVSFLSPAGKISALPVATGASSGVTLDADIDLLETGNTLKAEFDADVDILLGEKNGVINVPTEALKSAKGGKTLVYVVNSNGKVTEKEVKVGLQSDVNAEILSGVNEGEKVILNPNTSIENGVIVKESGEGGK